MWLELLRSLSRRFRWALVGGLVAAAVLVVGLGRVSAVRHVGVVAAGGAALLGAWILLVPRLHDLLRALELLPPEPPVPTGPRAGGAEAPDAGGVAGAAPQSFGTPDAGVAPEAGRDARAASEPGPAADRGSLSAFLAQDRAPPEVDDTELRIGIVLAGGGARGVYQAGALAALWEFLEREGALPYVRAVAGTSIGAWNAMFWLTGQVSDGELARWWREAEPARLVEPARWFPWLRNYLLRDRPWREAFGPLFSDRAESLLGGGPPWLYFTRTAVDRARVEVGTNRGPDYRYYRAAPSGSGYEPVAPVVDETLGRFAIRTFEELREAVFTSMDIPPVFPRFHDRRGLAYEDGGVIDNLPIRYATRFEGCNLLFIFPLHASFEQRHSERSILRRLGRVMEVRQGALERDALRDISLYNELIGLGAPSRRADIHVKPVTSFILAPSRELPIGTFDFWKLPGGGSEALACSRAATRAALEAFEFDTADRSVRMQVFGPEGRPSETHDFTLR
ncbi:MAG TPA: patatin-like phospholipase family protein [Gemmatimonadota bacterium]|nr:patatin-like phospholipase family protein [Gemmatimonadota bacterium]